MSHSLDVKADVFVGILYTSSDLFVFRFCEASPAVVYYTRPTENREGQQSTV